MVRTDTAILPALPFGGFEGLGDKIGRENHALPRHHILHLADKLLVRGRGAGEGLAPNFQKQPSPDVIDQNRDELVIQIYFVASGYHRDNRLNADWKSGPDG